MNKNKKSFAARAKNIINRYKRAKFDPVEKQELDAALAALAQEQEAYKQANGIGEYSQEQQSTKMPVNELPQYANGVKDISGVNDNPLSNALLNQLYTSDLLPPVSPLNDFRISAVTGRPMLPNAGLTT